METLKKIGGTVLSYLISIGLILGLSYLGGKFVPILSYPILSQAGLVLVGSFVFSPFERFVRSLIFKFILKSE